MKHLPPKAHFKNAGDYNSRQWVEEMPEGVEYADLFREDFWVHHASKVRLRELVRCIAVDGSFDVMLVVEAKVQGGLKMREWPVWPAEADVAKAEATRTAPIVQREVAGRMVPCVEHTKITKWRVIGLDGNEISRMHQTKDEAMAALTRHFGAIGKDVVVADAAA